MYNISTHTLHTIFICNTNLANIFSEIINPFWIINRYLLLCSLKFGESFSSWSVQRIYYKVSSGGQ